MATNASKLAANKRLGERVADSRAQIESRTLLPALSHAGSAKATEREGKADNGGGEKDDWRLRVVARTQAHEISQNGGVESNFENKFDSIQHIRSFKAREINKDDSERLSSSHIRLFNALLPFVGCASPCDAAEMFQFYAVSRA